MMKQITIVMMMTVAWLACGATMAQAKDGHVQVITTLTDYADVARYVGGDRVEVKAICEGDQDAHFVRPKPSFAVWMSQADLFVTTGLDLELWVPSVMDKSGNARIREGQEGYVAAAAGVRMLEIPEIKDRSQGGVHIYGNPHVHTSPLNMKIVAKNIAIGLSKVDPAHAAAFEQRARTFATEIDRRMFGAKLVSLLGADTLSRLAESGKLLSFLKGKTYQGKPMTDQLDGWMKRALAFDGREIVTYHKNWIYFARLFGLKVVGEVEPKPSIPPSPKHVEDLIRLMKDKKIPLILAANYFDEDKVRSIASAVGAVPVIVPMYTGGVPEVRNYFQLVDHWLSRLEQGFLGAQ